MGMRPRISALRKSSFQSISISPRLKNYKPSYKKKALSMKLWGTHTMKPNIGWSTCAMLLRTRVGIGCSTLMVSPCRKKLTSKSCTDLSGLEQLRIFRERSMMGVAQQTSRYQEVRQTRLLLNSSSRRTRNLGGIWKSRQQFTKGPATLRDR